MDQFLRVRIIQQEREALDGLVRQPAGARLFPGQVVVKNIDLVPAAEKLLATVPAPQIASKTAVPLDDAFDSGYLIHSRTTPALSTRTCAACVKNLARPVM
jgi:hypothetical protein